MAIHEEVAAAMRWARERCQMTPEQFARELSRLTGQHGIITEAMVVEVEDGRMVCFADWLVAAARLAEQPVSVAFGELKLYEVTIPALESRLAAVEDKVERARLGRQS